jgi:hypothetical protein
MAENMDVARRWQDLENKLEKKFGRKPSIEVILFLIGIQETGFIGQKFSKEEKQDLMHVATCTVLAPCGFYEFENRDEDGWLHFKQIKKWSFSSPVEEQFFLKEQILSYFEI